MINLKISGLKDSYRMNSASKTVGVRLKGSERRTRLGQEEESAQVNILLKTLW